MMGRMKALRTLAAAATTISCLTLPAHSQGFGKRGGAPSTPPVETHPKADEKAYRAALDRIPVLDQKYDPWGIARPAEPAKSGKKSN
jgi:hypothetical protein